VFPGNSSISDHVFRKILQQTEDTRTQRESTLASNRFQKEREILYSILFEFGVPMKPVRLNKMYLNKNYCESNRCKHMSDAFPAHNELKQGDELPPLILNFALQYAISKVQENHMEFILI
jgi:hypothetical protein